MLQSCSEKCCRALHIIYFVKYAKKAQCAAVRDNSCDVCLFICSLEFGDRAKPIVVDIIFIDGPQREYTDATGIAYRVRLAKIKRKHRLMQGILEQRATEYNLFSVGLKM